MRSEQQDLGGKLRKTCEKISETASKWLIYIRVLQIAANYAQRNTVYEIHTV